MTNADRVVLLGLPASREEFGRRVQGPPWDWGASLGACRSDWEDACTSASDLFGVAQSLIEDGIRNCYTVVPSASMHDVAGALALARIVVIVAHWRGSAVKETDLLAGWEQRVDELVRCADDPVGTVLRPLLDGGAMQPRDVVLALNHAIETDVFRSRLPGGLASRVQTDVLIRRTLARDLIDRAFAACMAKGNMLELFDGLHAPAEFDRCMPKNFEGTLDLSCCTSSVLATFLKLGRPSLDVIGGSELLVPSVQLRLISWALQLTAEYGGSYRETRLACARAMGDHFRS